MSNQFTHPWTSQEINFLKSNIQKLTYKQMGNIINRSPASIQSKTRFLPCRKRVKKYLLNYGFFKTWSEEMAYVLGFIAADGNICHSGRAHVLHIACDDEDIIRKIKKVLRYNGPIHQKFRENNKISYSLRICDLMIFKDLQKLHVTERKSLTFNPPLIPRRLIRHFIRGYFDGDGSVSFRNSKYPSRLVVDFYTASKKMADFLYQKIKFILSDVYEGKIYIRNTNQKTKYYAIRVGHNASVKIFNYMYKNANLYLERKYKKFIEGMDHHVN
jgi:DNA-binding transcriptional regulator WhiA